MKRNKLLCILLVCIALFCCACQSYTGDMEKALTAFEWQDYDTAIGESEAFLKRVPHSAPAQLVRQSAAWAKFFLIPEKEIKLPGCTLVIGDGSYRRDEYGNYALTLKDFSNHIFRDYDLIECEIFIDFDTTYFERDMELSVVKLKKLTVRYTISDMERTTALSIPELRKSGITQDQFISEHFVQSTQFMDRTVIPALEELFSYLQDTHNITPEQLGFTAWNNA